jgi:type IV pilus assembly protein PilC
MTIGRARRPAVRQLAVFTRQLAVMVEAGLPLVQCLDVLARDATGSLAPIIREVRRSIERGASLAAAFERRRNTFNRLYVSMVAAGEASGTLDVILARLASFLEHEARLASRIRAAMAYPAAVLAIAIVVIAVILWRVVPTFTALFEGLDASLPLPTRLVVMMSEQFAALGPLAAAGALTTLWAFRRHYRTDAGRLDVDRLLLRAPVVGTIARKVAVARFCRTLSTLIGAGVPILNGLDIAARTAGNAVIERALGEIRRRIERGATMGQPLGATGVFPPMVAQMVTVGETTGTLEAMLARVADFYESEVEVAMTAALALVEPALVAVLGVVVGGIVVSMYLPLVELIGQLS